jgi:single-stranded-DNA-specific exonuclease
MPRFRWIEPVRTAAGTDLVQLGLLGEVLVTRGFTTLADATRFLDSDHASLPDPFTLPDVEAAVRRIHQAISRHERVAIFGDYDVDGVSSTALMLIVLGEQGVDVRAYLPHRERDGYGLNATAVRQVHADGCSLLITVDCGTGNDAELQLAASLGLDAIVIDHHHVSSEDLPTTAFVSPRRASSTHPFDNYAAVGVAFQVLRALTDDRGMDRHLPLVALGTVADVVPLVGANRTIVKRGLTRFPDYAGPGLQALALASGLKQERITSHHIGFMLGPRINAAGRIDDPYAALKLLTTDSEREALRLADALSRLNTMRQELLQDSVEEAKRVAEDDGMIDLPVMVVRSPDWRVGLVGLIASRLSDHYRRPVIAIEQGQPYSRGSARSIDEFNVVDALGECADLLKQFGGHSKAAGLTIETNLIADFTERINDVFVERVGEVVPDPALHLDAVIEPDSVSLALVEELAQLEPFGNGNPTPVFMIRGARIADARRSRNQAHLLFNVVRPLQPPLRAVAFGAGERLRELASLARADLAVSLRPNTWQGRTSVTLETVDFREVS